MCMYVKFFIFIYFSLIFQKYIFYLKFLQNYTTITVWYVIWVQLPYGTTVGGATVFQPPYHTTFVNSTSARVLEHLQPPCDTAVRVSLFSKNHNFFLYELEWRYTLYENYRFRRDLQLCSSNFLHLKSSSNSNNQYSIQISVFYQDPVWHLGTTAVSYGGNKIVLQNLKWDIYCWKNWRKKQKLFMYVCECVRAFDTYWLRLMGLLSTYRKVDKQANYKVHGAQNT
jgi:hypothetical protein